MSSITTTNDDDEKQENSPLSDDNIDSQLIAMNNESLNGQIVTDCYRNVVNGMNGSINRFMDGIAPPPLLSCGEMLDVYGQEEEWAQEVAADCIEILPDLLCVDRRIVLDTVNFLAGPINPSSWEEGENLTNTTSGSAHNEDTDTTTNEENDKKSTSGNSGLFSSFFGSGINGRTKKKNAPIRSSTGGHKIRPAWYPKSLIRIRNTKYVRWGECDGSGGIGIGIGGDECGRGGEEEKINSILQSYNDDVDVDGLSDSSGDALLLLTLGNINDDDDDFSVVSTPLPPASFTTTMTDNNVEGGQQEHQEDNKSNTTYSNGGDDINNSIVVSDIVEDKRTPEKEEECVVMPSSTISDEKKEKTKEKSTTAPTTAAITTTERDADAATAVVVDGGGAAAENKATITAPRPLSSASSFSPDDDNATTLVVTTRTARCGITPARIKRSNHLHGCAAAYFDDVIAPPIVAVGTMKSTAISALDEGEDHNDDNDYSEFDREGQKEIEETTTETAGTGDDKNNDLEVDVDVDVDADEREAEAEAEEGSVTSGRRSVASCSRSIISVAGVVDDSHEDRDVDEIEEEEEKTRSVASGSQSILTVVAAVDDDDDDDDDNVSVASSPVDVAIRRMYCDILTPSKCFTRMSTFSGSSRSVNIKDENVDDNDDVDDDDDDDYDCKSAQTEPPPSTIRRYRPSSSKKKEKKSPVSSVLYGYKNKLKLKPFWNVVEEPIMEDIPIKVTRSSFGVFDLEDDNDDSASSSTSSNNRNSTTNNNNNNGSEETYANVDTNDDTVSVAVSIISTNIKNKEVEIVQVQQQQEENRSKDPDGGEGEGEDQQSKGEVSDNTRDGAAGFDDDVVVVVTNEDANNPVSVVSNDEVKALVEMVVEISNNKDDDEDDHVSTISTTSKKSTSSIMSVPYLLKASMKRAKKLRKSNNRINKKLSSSTTTSSMPKIKEISFGKAAVAADKKEAEAEEGTAVGANETEAEADAEEGSVTSGRRSVASCSRSIISVAGSNGNSKSMKDPLKDIRLLDRLMKKNDQFKLRVERMEKLDRKAEALEQKRLLNVFASERSSTNHAMAAEGTILGVETGFEVLSMPVGGGGLEEL